MVQIPTGNNFLASTERFVINVAGPAFMIGIALELISGLAKLLQNQSSQFAIVPISFHKDQRLIDRILQCGAAEKIWDLSNGSEIEILFDESIENGATHDFAAKTITIDSRLSPIDKTIAFLWQISKFNKKMNFDSLRHEALSGNLNRAEFFLRWVALSYEIEKMIRQTVVSCARTTPSNGLFREVLEKINDDNTFELRWNRFLSDPKEQETGSEAWQFTAKNPFCNKHPEDPDCF